MYCSFVEKAASQSELASGIGPKTPHACDDCGQVKPDVDLWAESHDTGEELWLCEACGDL